MKWGRAEEIHREKETSRETETGKRGHRNQPTKAPLECVCVCVCVRQLKEDERMPGIGRGWRCKMVEIEAAAGRGRI